MSTNLNELCCSVVEEVYGEFYAKLYSQLAYHGRLSAPQLVQRSGISLRQVKAGLSVLVQQRLVYHHTGTGSPSTYQANPNASYNLLRIGPLVELAERQLGTFAATAMSEITSLGFATINELEDRTSKVLLSLQAAPRDGVLQEESSAVKLERKVRQDIKLLLEEGFLTHVRSMHFQAHYDARQNVETLLRNQGVLPSSKGRKDQIEIDARIDSEVQRCTAVTTPEHGTTRKRASDEIDDQPKPKRVRTSDKKMVKTNEVTGSMYAQDNADSSILVCASFQNLVAQIRNDLVVQKATRCLGAAPGRVVGSALQLIQSTEISNKSISEYRLNLEDLHDSLNHPRRASTINGNHQNGHHSNGTRDDVAVSTEEIKFSYGEVDRCLALLADGEFNFLYGKLRSDQWTVKRTDFDGYVQNQEILRMMGDRLGPPALRIVRMLMEKGKLDEKNLQEIGLLGAKDLRQTLAQLKQMGFVDLQEVPREAQRQPNRTIFLWFHDSERIRKLLLENLYKSMSRLMQRLKYEKAKLSSTLEKIERTDVQGREESAMSEAELRVLKRWYRREQWLFGEVHRLDVSVALLQKE